MDWVETTCSLVPEAAADLAALGRLYEGKLYHELTLALETFVNDPGHQGRGRLLLDLEQRTLLVYFNGARCGVMVVPGSVSTHAPFIRLPAASLTSSRPFSSAVAVG